MLNASWTGLRARTDDEDEEEIVFLGGVDMPDEAEGGVEGPTAASSDDLWGDSLTMQAASEAAAKRSDGANTVAGELIADEDVGDLSSTGFCIFLAFSQTSTAL